MFRTWRRATVVTLAGAVAISAQLTAGGQAQAAAPTITIAAASKFGAVTGDVLVIYRGGAYASAKVHGTISGAAAGEVARVYAQPFPYQKPPAPAGSVTLTTGNASYSFTVTPTLATHYSVRLFASNTATAPVATSAVKNVYVATSGSVSGIKACGRPTCHETIHAYTILPSSALRAEMAKRTYPYFGLNLGATKVPPPPASLTLNGGHASVTKPRRISATEYEVTFSYSFAIGKHSFYWLWTGCVQDTVTKDGLGLPGHHSCGASRIPTSARYLG